MRIDAEQTDPETLVLTVVGELDAAAAPQALRALEEGVASGAQLLVVDLTDMSFMDSTGLGVLLFAWSEMGRRDGRLVIVLPVDAHARRSLNLRGVTDRLSIAASRAEALGAK